MASRSFPVRNLLLTVLVVTLSSIGYLLRLYQDHHPAPSQTSPAVSTEPSYHPGKVPKIGRLLLATQSGSGNYTTPVFSASGSWNIYWDFECSAVQDSFRLTTLDGKHQLTATNHPADYQGKESGYGTTTYRGTGNYHLQITSTCQWHITVKTSS
jgi:hypothetical protein